MLRIVELDSQNKDHQTTVYVVNVGGEKVGISEPELLEIVTAKLSKTAAKRAAHKAPAKAAAAADGMLSDLPAWPASVGE